MRIWELAAIAALSALGARHLEPGSQVANSSPREPLEVAGLQVGVPPTAVFAILGQPNKVGRQPQTWLYQRGERRLTLEFDKASLVTIQAQGRWGLSKLGKSLPGFAASEPQIAAAYGRPRGFTTYADFSCSPYYCVGNCNLEFDMEDGRVTGFFVTRSNL